MILELCKRGGCREGTMQGTSFAEYLADEPNRSRMHEFTHMVYVMLVNHAHLGPRFGTATGADYTA